MQTVAMLDSGPVDISTLLKIGNQIAYAGAMTIEGDPINVSIVTVSRSKRNIAKASKNMCWMEDTGKTWRSLPVFEFREAGSEY